MNVTVRDLIAALEDQNPDAEVRWMSQPSWPFENSIAGITTSEDIETERTHRQREEEGDEYEDEGPDPDAPAARPIVYLVEGVQLKYGDKLAWDLATRI